MPLSLSLPRSRVQDCSPHMQAGARGPQGGPRALRAGDGMERSPGVFGALSLASRGLDWALHLLIRAPVNPTLSDQRDNRDHVRENRNRYGATTGLQEGVLGTLKESRKALGPSWGEEALTSGYPPCRNVVVPHPLPHGQQGAETPGPAGPHPPHQRPHCPVL